MGYSVRFLEKVYFTPVMPLVAKAWAYLEDAGMGDGSPSFSYESSAFYIEIGGKPVAFLLWHVVDWKREAWIELGFVEPEYRERGMYTALYNALLEEAKKRNLRCISGGTSFDNTVMREVAKAQGRVAKCVVYTHTFPLPESDDEGKQGNLSGKIEA